MRHSLALLLAALAWATALAIATSKTDECVVGDGHVLAARGSQTRLLTDPRSPAGIHRAVASFAKDIEAAVPGAHVSVRNVSSAREVASFEDDGGGIARTIIVGALNEDGGLAGSIAAETETNVSHIEGQWEAWSVSPARLSSSGASDVLLVSGADKRGTIYALYTLSEQMGVSPWHWFADVATREQAQVHVQACWHPSPTVKYRGIFLNDEQPGLTNWANKHFGTGSTLGNKDPLMQSFLPSFYEHVFDLLLRLKANMLWPALWSDMFAVAGLDALPKQPLAGPNQAMADAFGIIYSTSHQEPMARNTPEWTNYGTGEWNYTTNKAELDAFWRYGAERAAKLDTIFSVGMRGDGDIPLPGASVPLLESLVAEQRNILSDAHGGADVTTIPQLWCLYKEVQSYYDEDGLAVPDDVTLLWTDDNWGNLRRVPSANETARAGGSGLYYHFDYVGDPRNYKWISTINFAKTWEQLSVAQQTGLDRIFILNVGDLKPIEVATHYALDLSYRGTASAGMAPDEWLRAWSRSTFPALPAADVARVVAGYNMLNNRIKPELLNATTWSLAWHNEAEAVEAAWDELTSTVARLRSEHTTDAAFEQLVAFPTLASANLNRLYTAVGRANLHASQARNSANLWADRAADYFLHDGQLTAAYHALLDGKWDGMMSQSHINYAYWQQPMRDTMPPVARVQTDDAWPAEDGYMPSSSPGPLRVTIEGSKGAWPGDNVNNCAQGYSCPPPSLQPMDRYGAQKRWIDVSSGTWRGVSYSVSSNVSWLTPSTRSGHLAGDGSTDARVWVTVDWDKAPKNNLSYGGISIMPANGTLTRTSTTTVTVPIDGSSVEGESRNGGFVEGDGIVAMPASNATRTANTTDASWLSLPGYGLTGQAMTVMPATAPTYEVGKGPALVFDFYSSASGPINVTTYLGPILNYRAGNPRTYALQIDDGAPATVQPIPLASSAGSDPPDWNGVVAAGARTKATQMSLGSSTGWHTLTLWATQPGLVVEMVVVGQAPLTSLPPPPSYRMAD